MRMDKLTSKFQMALADAQSLAVGQDHQFIEPAHVMIALLDQQGGSVRGLLVKSGANVNLLRSQLGVLVDKLPKVEGAGGEVHEFNRAAIQIIRNGSRSSRHVGVVVRPLQEGEILLVRDLGLSQVEAAGQCDATLGCATLGGAVAHREGSSRHNEKVHRRGTDILRLVWCHSGRITPAFASRHSSK